MIELNKSIYGVKAPPKFETAAAEGTSDPIEIRVDCIYIPVVGELDVTLNTFKVKVDLDLSWKATQEDVENYTADQSNYTPTFVPNLVFANSFSVEFDDIIPIKGNIRYQMEQDEDHNDGGYRIKIRHRLIGTMSNRFSTQYFPFDVQNLVLSIGLSFYTRQQVKFVMPKGIDFAWVPTMYTNLPGFDLVRVVVGETHPDGFSSIIVVVQAKRHMEPYLFRILLPLFAINLSTFSIYALSDLEGKTGILLTAMLSFVGMIYILSTLIPMAGKGTLFDQYAMASTLVCIFGLFFNSYSGNNNISFWLHLCIFVLLHTILLITAIIYKRNADGEVKLDFEALSKRYQLFEPLTYGNAADEFHDHEALLRKTA